MGGGRRDGRAARTRAPTTIETQSEANVRGVRIETHR